MVREPTRPRRSLLFTPASRPDRCAKALASGADAVCIDLEDGVGLDTKAQARHDAMRVLADRTSQTTEVWLRINDPRSDLGRLDLETLRDTAHQPDALVVPKVRGAEGVRQLAAELHGDLTGTALVPMIESAAAMVAVETIAAASPNISALLFGAIDYCADVGCAVEWDALLHARSRMVLAAAAVGVDALDGPFTNIAALDALETESRGAARLGFTGKIAIHPTQIDVIQRAFTPSPEDIVWARRVIAAYDAAGGGALQLDGILIDRPVIAAARRTLRSASAPQKGSNTPG